MKNERGVFSNFVLRISNLPSSWLLGSSCFIALFPILSPCYAFPIHLTPYQIAAPLFSMLAIVYAWNLVLRGKKSIWETGLWTIFWGFVALIALFPNALSYLSAITGIANQENAVLVTFMGILFFIVFYIIIRLEELEQRHAKLVSMLALRAAGLEEGTLNDSKNSGDSREGTQGKRK